MTNVEVMRSLEHSAQDASNGTQKAAVNGPAMPPLPTDAMIIDKQFAEPGQQVLIVAGWSPAAAGSMNGLVIHIVGTPWTAVPTAQDMRKLLKAEKE